MFQKARIKLTLWYVLVTAFVGFLFSISIYSDFNRELTRIELFQQIRLEDERIGVRVPSFPRIEMRNGIRIAQGSPQEIINEVSQSRLRLLSLLAFINLGVIAIAGAGGYFLSGKTLRPIQEMLDEQSRFITDASHELRTPITSLKTAIEVTLRDKKITLTDAKATLVSNLSEVNNLQTLTDSLIILSQYQKGIPANGMKKENMRSIIEEAIKKVSIMKDARKIKFKKYIDNFTLLGNRQTLTELFVIFLDNAIKYSPTDSTITITVKKSDKTGRVIIADTGRGIAKEDLPFIFERFYRADKSRAKSDAEGYGLGLAIAKEIVAKYNGEISATSNTQGTTITTKFPLSK